MIRTLSFTKARALYQHISDHNDRSFIMAKQGTPVSTLVDPIIAPALFYDPNSEDYASVGSITSLIERNAQVSEGVDAYDLTLQNFVSLAGEAIRRTAYLTKSVALPIIESITVDAETKLNEISGGEGLALNIVPDTQAVILVNPVLVSAIEPFTAVAGPNTGTVNVHAPRDTDQLLEIMRVGYDDFDKEMSEWIAAHLSSEIVATVYKKVFSSASKVVDMVNVFDGSADSYPEALVCFLLVRGLIQNPDDGINMSAGNYDNAMAMITNYSAMVIKRAMRHFDRADRNERVVLRYPRQGQELSYDNPEQGVIVVNKTVYDKFLAEGGSPEAVMGSYLFDRSENKTDLLAERDMYVKQYNTRIMKLRSDNRLRIIITMRKHIERLVANEIAITGIDNGDKGLWAGIDINQAAAQNILRGRIDRLRLEDMDNMYGTIRDIILGVFFAETDVPKLIELIDANSKDNAEDIKSAVNVALIDYIVDWFMHQTEIQSI